MIINKQLTMIRCELNQTNIDTSLMTLAEQATILEECLSLDITYDKVKAVLDKAMRGEDFIGWKDELENMIRNDEKLRGHDYLKTWFKHYFVLEHGANFIIADAATHNMLQNRLTYEQKNELLHIMRGRKAEMKA